MTILENVVQLLRQERNQAKKRIEQLDGALIALTGLDGVRKTTARSGGVRGKVENHISGGAARPVGKVESGSAQQIAKTMPSFPHFSTVPFTDIWFPRHILR